MNRCSLCRRPLKDPDSIAQGMGPGCARKAARAGSGPDLFAQVRAEAIEALRAAAESCRGLGVVVNLSIEEQAA
jgi:hypothetical protein